MKAPEDPRRSPGFGEWVLGTADGLGCERAVLFTLVPDARCREAAERELDELASLCRTLGLEPAARLIQVRARPTPAAYLGRGKVAELAALLERHDAGLAVCDDELSPVQGRNLERALAARVLDRSEIILAIFAAHARSRPARIQVELARLEYELPRLRRRWTHLHRERGGLGAVAGMGEKQIEVDRRLMQRRIAGLRKRLATLEERGERTRKARRGRFLCSLVGYTNAGKSSLLRRLTGARVRVEDRLFTTLDTRTRPWDLGGGRMVLLSDTVGFVRKLPHRLIASFQATLAETLEADLLLVVVDLADSEVEAKTEAVFGVLDEIGAGGKDRILVANKLDLAGDRRFLPLLAGRFGRTLAVSSVTGEGLDALSAAVRERLDAWARTVRLRIPHRLADLQAALPTVATVLEARYDGAGGEFLVRIAERELTRLLARGAVLAPDADPSPQSVSRR